MFRRNRFAYCGDSLAEVWGIKGGPASHMDEIEYPPVPEDLVESGVTNGSIGFTRRKSSSPRRGTSQQSHTICLIE